MVCLLASSTGWTVWAVWAAWAVLIAFTLPIHAPYILPSTQASVFPLQQYEGSPELFPMPPCGFFKFEEATVDSMQQAMWQGNLSSVQSTGSFKLEEATIDEMQQAMSQGSLSSVQLTLCYMQRTYQLQSYTNSLLQLNPDVLQIASSLDAERRAGHVRSRLHGIPFTVKDNIASKDNMETTAGSWALLGSIVPRDAHVLKRLREAGAVLLGKAAMSEWADMRSSNYSEGYSARGGQVRSAYNFTVNPGGSSSGSGVAVGSNAIAFSVGTETDGSVINPAMRNAVVGFKPSVGLTSRAGVVPESEHQDSIGTFARTVRDAVYVLDAIYGPDSNDNYTSTQIGHAPDGGYAQYLTHKSSLANATFGIPWNSFWVHADGEQLATLLAIVDLIESAGATIVNETEILDYETIVSPDGWNWDYGTTRGFPNESEFTVVKVDFYNNIAAYLSELTNTDIRNLSDIVQYNYDNDGTEGGSPWPQGNPAFWSGQDAFLASLETGGVQDETYFQALAFTQTKCKNGIDHALTAYRDSPLSGLLVPPQVGQSYQMAAQAQYPVITIPAGYHNEKGDHGMPYGLALIQTMWAEAELVRWGSAIEDLIDTEGEGLGVGRKRPRWLGYKERNLPVPF